MKNILYILTITVLFLTGCKNKSVTENTDNNRVNEEKSTKKNTYEEKTIAITKAQFESNKMTLGSLIEKDFPELVKTTGMIDVPPQSKEIISSFYGGFVKKSSLLIGDKVRKGQALVTIENPDFVDMQQNYLEIKEQLTYLKTEYERQKTLFNEQITSQKNYLKAESDYKRKVATLNGLRKKLKMLNISSSSVENGNITSVITLYSSISGTISKINVSKGTHISPADEVMEIINTDHIHLELQVFEKDAMKIEKDQKIRFKIPEISSTYYDAEVHLVGKSIDEVSRTIKVHGHLHNKTKNKFDLGMFVDAEIETLSHKSLALPEDAIIEEGEHLVVLKLKKEENENSIFEQVKVEIGKKYNGFVQIKSTNLKPTDTFLVKGAYSLVGGDGGGHSH